MLLVIILLVLLKKRQLNWKNIIVSCVINVRLTALRRQ